MRDRSGPCVAAILHTSAGQEGFRGCGGERDRVIAVRM